MQLIYVSAGHFIAGSRSEGAGGASERLPSMPTFRIFYFRHSVLDHTEEVEAPNVIDAATRASGTSPDLKAEIWSDKGRVGIIGTSRDAAHRHFDFLRKARPRLPT